MITFPSTNPLLTRNRQAMDLTSGRNSMTRLLEQNRDLISGRNSMTRLLEQNPDLISCRNSMTRLLEQNREIRDFASGRNPMTRMLEENRKWQGMISDHRSMTTQMAQNREWQDLMSGRSSVTKALESYRGLVDSVLSRSSFVEQIGPRTTVAQLSQLRGFSTMIGTAGMPRDRWSRVLDDLRTVVPSDLREQVAAGLHDAADVAAEHERATWWVARLPLPLQFFLLLTVLQTLDKAGQLVGDLTGDDLPPAYRTATEALFCLAFSLYAFIDARVQLDRSESHQGDSDGHS